MRKIKSLRFCYVLLCSVLLLSCDTSFNEPLREYFEYWTENVFVGRYETVSSHRMLGSQVNVSARENVRMDLILTNAKNFNLEVEGSGSPYFSVLSSDGNDVAFSKSISISTPQKNVISLSMALPDETEKEILSLEGKFYIIKNSERFEQTYSFSFRQNTPPDNPRNLRNPEEAEIDGYHCLHFDYPDQSLKRHQNLTYNVSCYLFENGAYTHIGTKSLTSSDSKSSSDFTYYFENQEPSLRYDYVVTAVNPDGLKSETVSTAPNLGINYVTEPEISFSGNGDYNELTAEKDGVSYSVIEYTGSSLSATVKNTSVGADMTVKINGESSSTTSDLADGFNTIEVTVSKNLCRPITVTKNVYVIKAQNEPTVRFYKHDGNNVMEPSEEVPEESGYSGYTCYNMALTQGGTGNANFEVALGSRESLDVEIDSTQTTANNGKYTIDLGPHILKLTVTKEYCTPKVFTKKVYIQGILIEPEVTSSNEAYKVGFGSGNTDNDPQEWQFSYLSNDTMNCKISAGNTHNTVNLNVDGFKMAEDSVELHPSSSTYKLEITQTREHCKTLVTTKYVTVKIKPITLTLGNIKMYHDGDDKNDEVELDGNIYCNVTGCQEQKYNFDGNTRYKKQHDITWDISFTITNKDVEFSFRTDNMIDHDGISGKDYMGSVNTSRSLKELRTNKDFKLVGTGADNNCSSWYEFTVGLRD